MCLCMLLGLLFVYGLKSCVTVNAFFFSRLLCRKSHRTNRNIYIVWRCQWNGWCVVVCWVYRSLWLSLQVSSLSPKMNKVIPAEGERELYKTSVVCVEKVYLSNNITCTSYYVHQPEDYYYYRVNSWKEQEAMTLLLVLCPWWFPSFFYFTSALFFSSIFPLSIFCVWPCIRHTHCSALPTKKFFCLTGNWSVSSSS